MTSPPLQAPDRIDGRVGALVAVAAWLAMVFAVWLAWVLLQVNSRAIAGADDTNGTSGMNGTSVRIASTTFPETPAAPAGDVPIERTLIEATERGQDLRAAQRASLERWGWTDRAAGKAEIPIERAMELVIEEEGRP